MAQQTLVQAGVFTGEDMDKVNSNFSELYGSAPVGSLTDAHILVGDGSDVATDVAVSGDAAMANTGAVTVTGVNGAALTADGAEIQALVDESVDILAAAALIANISTVNVASPEIWNDNGTLKLGSA